MFVPSESNNIVSCTNGILNPSKASEVIEGPAVAAESKGIESGAVNDRDASASETTCPS